jgi:hypothetical protein
MFTAWPGKARLGGAWLGMAGHGVAWLGGARRGKELKILEGKNVYKKDKQSRMVANV